MPTEDAQMNAALLKPNRNLRMYSISYTSQCLTDGTALVKLYPWWLQNKNTQQYI